MDAALRLKAVSPSRADLIDSFEPSGEGNPTPTFVSRATIISQMAVGDRPVRLRVADGGCVRRAVVFRPQAIPATGTRVDLYYEVRRNEWRGDQQIDLVVQEGGLLPVAEG